MKRLTPSRQALTLALIAGTFTAGCSSTSSNTTRDAAAGAAIGAVAGAIIGNNHGDNNGASGAAIGAAAGAVAGGAYGHNEDRKQASVYANSTPGDSAAVTNIYVPNSPPMPPAPIAESIPSQPVSNAVWIPGYWNFDNGNSYAWTAGRWEIPPQNTRSFQPPQWRRQGNGYVYVRAYWY